MDIIYVVKKKNGNDRLKYSLRSLKNIEHDKVWIAGHTPNWCRNVGSIPVLQTGSRFENSTMNLLLACAHPEVSEECVYFNDDFFVMKKLDEIPVLHRGLVKDVLKEYKAKFGDSKYSRGAEETARFMKQYLHIKEPISYELHVPLPFRKSSMAKVLRLPMKYNVDLPVLHKRSLYGNYLQIGGTQIPDVKIHNGSEIPKDSPFLFSTATSMDAELGRYVRNNFPEKCRYEK